jgi:hypothetical protein
LQGSEACSGCCDVKRVTTAARNFSLVLESRNKRVQLVAT